jgi:uncharacterized membrane protein required for colicin V production
MQDERTSLVKTITSPLGFFVLSLLIVEAFLSTVLIFSDLDVNSKYVGMWMGAILFLIVVVGVLLLVWFKPTHLTFGEKSHLDLLKAQNSWGTSDEPETKKEVENSPLTTPEMNVTI